MTGAAPVSVAPVAAAEVVRNDLRFTLVLLEPDIFDEDLAGAFDFDADFAGCLADRFIVIDGFRDQMAVQNVGEDVALRDDFFGVPVVLFKNQE